MQTPPPDPRSPADALAALTHHRWALPVLAVVARSRGAKFVTLSRRLGASPPSVKRALDRLAALDLVVRNPGYGHPMRPEYVLGGCGADAAEAAVALVEWMDADGLRRPLLKKWQLPVLVALSPEARRFTAIRTRLPSATPRAVALALKDHTARELVERTIQGDYPPVPLYTPTARALPGRASAGFLAEVLVGAGGG